MKGLGLPPIRVTDDETGEWIEIKAKLTRGDQEAYRNLIMKITGEGSVDILTVDWLTPMLEMAVVGWELKTEGGQPWPYTRARVRELPADSPLLTKVQEAIAEANPTFGLTGGLSVGNG